MLNRRSTLAACLAGAFAWPAFAQAPAAPAPWPTKPVKFVVAFAPAGPADIIARLLGQKLGEALGQSVVVENRPGAGGSVASQVVARAEPDGYTLLINTSSYAVNPSMQRNLGFDAEKDLTLATLVAQSPNLIAIAPQLKARTLREVMEDAKGGTYNYGTAGAGTTPHLTAEYLFKVLGKVPVTHVPFQGAGPALNATMGAQTQLASVALPAAVELVKSGRVRGLVVTGSKRSAALPDVPTVAESGFPGFEDVTWVGVFAPAKTPDAILQRINREVARLQQDPDFLARLAATGFEPLGGSVAESRDYLHRELAKWARVVKETGAQAN
ncbi:MAG: tripartite tricarboxylate transporter substrate binding protein [Burkholderiales bacterium]|nr:tripartite tricarboxylate transporter substrate binding protein [Burkholderiales bacterium]